MQKPPVIQDKKPFDVLDQHRFRELDGLRGIASMMVSLGHAMGTVIALPAGSGVGVAIGSIAGVINGAVAVDLFFIMSGFFLTGMLEKVVNSRLRSYYLRRLARLVPPATTAVIIIYIYSLFALRPGVNFPDAADAFATFQSLNEHMPLHILCLNLVLIRHTLNPVLWTIRLEIFTSILFPFVIFLKKLRSDAWYKILLFWLFLAIAVILRNHQKLGIDVFHYLYIFYAGSLLKDFGYLAERVSSKLQYGICGLAIFLICLTGEYNPLFGVHPILFDFPITIFGTALVALLAYAEIPVVKNFMNSAGVQFLGRISYSVYLINWLSVRGIGGLMLAHGFPARYGFSLSIVMLVITSTLGTLAMGYLLHIAAEQPSVALSRYLGRKAA